MRGIRSRLGIFRRVPMTKDLLTGEILYFLLGEIIIIFLALNFKPDEIWQWTFGFFEGFLLAVFILLHMALALEDSVAMYEEEADKHTKKTYMFRMIILVVTFLLIVFLGLGNVGTALFGLMALKVAAYIQPFTHKFTQKSISEGR